MSNESAVDPNLPGGTSQKIRDLASYEEFFWLLEQSYPCVHTSALTVEGHTERQEWEQAWRQIIRRYPMLRASIHKEPGQRPFFATSQAPAELTIKPWSEDLQLTREMEREFELSFGKGEGPLVRMTLFYGSERCALLLAAHHAAFDGKTSLLLLQDLLAALDGEEMQGVLSWPSLNNFLHLAETAEYSQKIADRPSAPAKSAPLVLRKAQVAHLSLTADQTTTLTKRAKEENTSLHSALVTAFSMAGARHSTDWQTKPVASLTPIDARQADDTATTPGLLITSYLGPIELAKRLSFWEYARQFGDGLRSGLSLEGKTEFMAGTVQLVSEESTPAELFAKTASEPAAINMLMSNYASYKLRTDYKRLHITAALASVISGIPEIQTITVLNENGVLGMTHASRGPFPHLLEDALKILMEN